MVRSELRGDLARFLVAGVINTGLTTVIYLVLQLLMPAGVAYAIAWAVGITFVILVYPDRVFAGARRGWASRVQLGLSTVVVFLLGLLILQAGLLLTKSPYLAYVLALVCTTAANFVAGRFVLKRA